MKGGGDYIPGGVGFCLFDVRVGPWWLARVGMRDVARKLGIGFPPAIGTFTLDATEAMVRDGLTSWIAQTARPMEGVVLRPPLELFDRRGERIITKLKTKDYGVVPVPKEGE